jgi:hypothetical protein
MTHQTRTRTEALMIIALKELLNLAEFDREGSEIVAMRLRLQHEVNLDPAAVCGEIEDLLEILQSEDRELIAV